MTKPTIAFICRTYLDHLGSIKQGGAERVIKHMTEYFYNRGYSVTVYQLGASDFTTTVNGVDIIQVKVDNYRRLVKMPIDTNSSMVIFQDSSMVSKPYFRNTPLLIGIHHGVYWDYALELPWKSWYPRAWIPSVLYSIILHLFRRLAKRRELRGVRRADLTIAMDTSLLRIIQSDYPSLRHKLVRIMPFSDLSNGNNSVGRKALIPLTTDSQVILVPRHYSLSAGLFWLKDIALELDAIVPNKNWRIVVAGSLKSDGRKMEHLVHALAGGDDPRYRHISNRLVFLGELNRIELREQLSTAFLVCIPTFAYEGACLAAVEALSMGTPVVATNIGGLNDTIVPGFNGLLSRPCPIEIAQTLARLLTDFGLYNRIVANVQLTSGQFDLAHWYVELDHVFGGFRDDLWRSFDSEGES